jgi:hypothetical protein
VGSHRLVVALVSLAAIGLTSMAGAQHLITSAEGTSSLKLGALTQVQAEWLDDADRSGTAQNLFVRRIRVLLGGKLGERVSFFLDTDSPNLGKGGADGRKNEATLYIQDLVVTYEASPAVKVEGGMLLLPLAYKTGQSAATLLAVDYGPHSFVASSPTQCRVGRDHGLQGRLYPLRPAPRAAGGRLPGGAGRRRDQAAPFLRSPRVVSAPAPDRLLLRGHDARQEEAPGHRRLLRPPG